MTYVSPGAPPEARETYLHAINTALERCTPLPFSRGLGGRWWAGRSPESALSTTGTSPDEPGRYAGAALAIAACATGAAARRHNGKSIPQRTGAALPACSIAPLIRRGSACK